MQQQQQQQQLQSTDSGSRGKARSSDKASSAYASRHQAAEQRRRSRINDRLDRLRACVPHQDRANTAAFLDEVIKYVQSLQQRVRELEAAVGVPSTIPEAKAHEAYPAPSTSAAETAFLRIERRSVETGKLAELV
ncbi:hypothetical protein WJX73_001427 [Symbiochloris irregularis]